MKKHYLILSFLILLSHLYLKASEINYFLSVNGEYCTFCEYSDTFPLETCEFGPFCPDEPIEFGWNRVTVDDESGDDCDDQAEFGGLDISYGNPTFPITGFIYVNGPNGSTTYGPYTNITNASISTLSFSTPGTYTIQWGTPTLDPQYMITITIQPNPVFPGLSNGQTFCHNDAPILLPAISTLECTPVLSGPGIVAQGFPNTNYYFYPSLANTGWNTLTIQCGSCSSSISVYVATSPNIPNIPTLCATGEPFCWTKPHGASISGPGTSTTNNGGGPFGNQFCFDPSITGPGTYTITVTNLSGCFSTADVTVLPVESVDAGNDVVICTDVMCNSGVYLGSAPTPGTTYDWKRCNFPNSPLIGNYLDNPQSAQPQIDVCNPGTTNQLIANEPCIDFCVEATDLNGCVATDQVTVCFTNGETLPLETTVEYGCGVCNGIVTIDGLPSNVTTVELNSANVSIQNNTIADLCPGNYTLSYSEGCINYVGSFTVDNIPGGMIITPNVINTCEGQCTGEILLNVSGGSGNYQYYWSDGQVGNNPTGLCPGDYEVSVLEILSSGLKGCEETIIVTVEELPALQADFTANDFTSCFNNGTCDGEIVFNSATGTSPYIATWTNTTQGTSGSVPGVPGSSATGLCQGTYVVELTDDLQCTYSTTLTISNLAVNQTPQVILGFSAFPCSISAVISNYSSLPQPVTFEWYQLPDDGIVDYTGTTVTGLCGGEEFYIVVTDGAGCVQIITVIVANKTGATKSFTLHPNPARSLVYVTVPNPDPLGMILQLEDNSGTILNSYSIKGSTGLNVSSYPKGIYYVRIISSETTAVQKLILE